MSNLTVQNIKSNLVVDSRLIAEELGIQHRNFKETIRTYQSEFEELGQVAFETEAGDIRYAETFYYLNEDQCYLALTFSRNNDRVVKAKLNLVKAFKAAREPQVPTTYLEALKALVAAEEEKQQLALKAAEAEAKVVELAPKAEIYDVIANDENLLSLSDVAKVINVMGRNKLMELLRTKKVLQFSNLPYQKYVDAGYFCVVEKVTQHVGVQLVTKVTQRGVEFLIRLLQREGYTVPNKAFAA